MKKTYILIEVVDHGEESWWSAKTLVHQIRNAVHAVPVPNDGSDVRDFCLTEGRSTAVNRFLGKYYKALPLLQKMLDEVFETAFDKDRWRENGFRFKGDTQ